MRKKMHEETVKSKKTRSRPRPRPISAAGLFQYLASSTLAAAGLNGERCQVLQHCITQQCLNSRDNHYIQSPIYPRDVVEIKITM